MSFLASSRVTPAKVALSLSKALLRAIERADAIAFHKISV
jgi:hypothetical protein